MTLTNDWRVLRVKNYMELYFDGVGRILLADEDGRLTELSFLKERALPAGLNLEETPRFARRAVSSRNISTARAAPSSFRSRRRGTPFQLRRWEALQKNPLRQDGDLRGHSARRRLAEGLPRRGAREQQKPYSDNNPVPPRHRL